MAERLSEAQRRALKLFGDDNLIPSWRMFPHYGPKTRFTTYVALLHRGYVRQVSRQEEGLLYELTPAGRAALASEPTTEGEP